MMRVGNWAVINIGPHVLGKRRLTHRLTEKATRCVLPKYEYEQLKDMRYLYKVV